MLDNIQNIMLIFLIVLQSVVMAYILYTTYVKHQNDKKFWEQQEKISNEFLKQLQESSINESKCECEKSNSDKK